MQSKSLASILAMAALASGCSASSVGKGGAGAPLPPPPDTSAAAQRAIAEADIIQLVDGRLYTLSKLGEASVVDVSQPGTLALLGQATLPGQPFEMYLRDRWLITMSNGAIGPDGNATTAYLPPDSGGGSVITVVDVSDPQQLAIATSRSVPGEIADSRIVGDILYLATYENPGCYGCGARPRTMVTTFDVAFPYGIKQVEQVTFESPAAAGSNVASGSNRTRSIFVTDQRLYIGGDAAVDPNNAHAAKEGIKEGIIDVLDITDPTGRLGVGARLMVAGAILSRWQLDERDGVLRVISQPEAGRTGSALQPPEVETFRVESALSFTPLGHTTIKLPRPEGLRSVRFDATRAYAITYATPHIPTDPLFVIDLADPQNPRQRGQLSMPGFMFYLEPHGDRLIGLGVDRLDPGGSLNVSLFDVGNADAPRMLARVPFATPRITDDFEILNSEVSEDQDRIQKAFRVFEDGLVVVPFSPLRPYYTQGCGGQDGGVQLVEWKGDTLTRRALLPLPGNPRRAFENGDTMITVSDLNVRSFSLADPNVAHQTADVAIGTCVPLTPDYGYQAGGGVYQGEGGYATACAVAPGHRQGAGRWLITLAAAAMALSLRRRRPQRAE
jgi:hypothetical protein